jgi:hypothetical protein
MIARAGVRSKAILLRDQAPEGFWGSEPVFDDRMSENCAILATRRDPF